MNNWTEVTIWTSTAGIDAVTGMLMDLGIDGFVIEDSQDFEDFLHDTEIYWDYVDEKLSQEKKDAETNVKIYVEDSPAGAEMLAQVNAGLAELRARDTEKAFGRCVTELASIRQEDWENNWKQYFKPFRVGRHFYVKPSWETIDDDEGRIVLHIDPASSFGTGTHHTTQLCLKQLEKVPVEGASVLDMGCGSGILGIAAALLGAKRVTAVDIDEASVGVTRENVLKNGIDPEKFTLLCGDVTGNAALAQRVGKGYDVVLANIVADVIIGMRRELFDFLRPGGTLIASGIIGERADEVQRALTDCGFALRERGEQQDWIVLRCERPL